MPSLRFVVCHMFRWSDFAITANGVDHALFQPEDSKVIGFIPVYADRDDAQSEALDHHRILAVMVRECDEDNEEESDGNDKSS